MSEPTLPQNPKMELDLTTTMVWEPKSIDLAVQRLPADGTGLMRPDARQLFLILVEMRRAGKLISPESLYEELRRRGKIEELGGDTFVQSLSASWGGTDHSDYYTRTLAHLHARRLAIVLGQNLKQRGYDETNTLQEDVLGFGMSSIREISESLLESKHHGIEEIFEDVFRDIEGKSNPGIPFGLTELDSYTDGVRPGELVVIAARASRGKTAMGLTIAEHMAIKRGVPLSFYSYEMSGKDILHRMLALATGYHLMKLRTGQYKADERVLRAVRGAAKGFKGRPFQLHDMRAVNKSIEHLCAHARCMKDKHGTAVIIIDYLQLIRAPRAAKENRQREVAEISASLRSLSAELDLTVIALAQLNREIESRGDGTPRLSDLRESGAIEQDADMVALLTRNDLPPDSKEKTADAMLYLAKQRNGPTGRIELGFQTESCRFVSKADIPIAAIEEARAQAEPDQEEMQFNQQTEEIEDGVPF